MAALGVTLKLVFVITELLHPAEAILVIVTVVLPLLVNTGVLNVPVPFVIVTEAEPEKVFATPKL